MAMRTAKSLNRRTRPCRKLASKQNSNQSNVWRQFGYAAAGIVGGMLWRGSARWSGEGNIGGGATAGGGAFAVFAAPRASSDGAAGHAGSALEFVASHRESEVG